MYIVLEQTSGGTPDTIFGVPDLRNWAPWLVMALILVLYMRQQGSSEGKKTDNVSALITALSDVVKTVSAVKDQANATDAKVEENTSAVEVMSRGVDTQNEILKDILGDQKSANEWQRKLYAEIIAISGDQGAAITAVSETITKTVEGGQAQLMARIDNMPERIATRMTPTLTTQHAATLQAIKAAGKSVEELFVTITRENADLKETVILKDQQITSLTTRLNEAVVDHTELERLRKLVAPSDFAVIPTPDPDPKGGGGLPIPGGLIVLEGHGKPAVDDEKKDKVA